MASISLPHPSTNELAQQAIHWAQLAVQENEQNIKIFIMPNKHWYKKNTPHEPLYLGNQVITYIQLDALTYETLL
jgi:hypothetical protein